LIAETVLFADILDKGGVHMKRKWAVMVIAFLLISCATSGGQQRATIPLDDSPNRGPVNAPVTVVEFFDYT
jgi:hypothetical protein